MHPFLLFCQSMRYSCRYPSTILKRWLFSSIFMTLFSHHKKWRVSNCSFVLFFHYDKATIDFSIWIFAFNVSAVLSSLTWPFLICFFATMATNCVASIGINAYGLNWYDFPAKLQKYIIMIVLRSQQPAYFSGLNLIFCTIETFGNVSNVFYSSFSAFSIEIFNICV